MPISRTTPGDIGFAEGRAAGMIVAVADHPSGFAAEEDWGPWVLNHGLPSLPASLAVGESVPVAYFAGPKYGAVAVVDRWFDAEDDERERLDFDVHTYIHDHGQWARMDSSGGTNWLIPDEPRLRRHDWIAGRDVEFAFEHGASTPAGACAAVIGIVGTEAASVRVRDANGEVVRPIDSPLGVAVAVAEAEAVVEVSVLDAEGVVLGTTTLNEPD